MGSARPIRCIACRPSARALAVCALLLPLAVLWLPKGLAAGVPTEISTSVVITNLRELESGTCEQVMANSKGFNARKINFVLTINSWGTDSQINRYAYANGDGGKSDADEGTINRFQAGLRRCFKAAVDAGFTTIHITPHVDPVRESDGRGVWRNLVKFNPTAKLNSYSYYDVLLEPAANALNEAINPDTVVEFALSAEQGLATFTYPKEWLQVMATTKAISSKGKDASRHLFGVSFNFDKVCGCVEVEESDPILYNNTYMDRFARFKARGGLKRVDIAGVKTLLSAVDFIGCSGYASLPERLRGVADMEVSIATVAFELQAFGIDLNELLQGGNKQFMYTEQGLGGYWRDNQMAPNLKELAKYPMRGAFGQYSRAADPWQVAQYKQYRRQLYRLMSTWAGQGGGPVYRIDGIFVWSYGSMDVHGVRPESSSGEGSYKDEAIIATIKAGNAAANGLGSTGTIALADKVPSQNPIAIEESGSRWGP